MKDIKRVFEIAIENVDTGIMFLDSEGLIRILNPVMSELIQCKKGEAIDRFFRDVVSPYNPLTVAVLHVLEQFYTGGSYDTRSSIEIKKGDISFYYDLSTHLIYGDNGSTRGLLLLISDSTSRNFMENNHIIREQCAQVSQLAAGAAHEIRNPLTTVRGFIQLLQKEFVNTPKEEYLNLVLSEIDRITKILQEFMQLVKPASGNPEPTNLKEITDEVIMLTEYDAKIRGIEVCSLIKGLPVAKVDRQQLKQVLINLFKNAFEAMPKGGKLHLRITPHRYKISIAVIDDGIGIEKRFLKNLGSPYFTTKETGTGLGLMISRQIINNHGGIIRIKSRPGKGTIVLIRLPLFNSTGGDFMEKQVIKVGGMS